MRRPIIRRARSNDIEACARIVAGDSLWLRYGLTLSGGRSILREAIGRPAVRAHREPVTEIAVATSAGKVVGFILFQRRGTFHHSGYVRWIAVALQARGEGIGRALMQYAESRIFRAGPNVFLTVSDFNRRAQAFYRRLGYRPIGSIPDYVLAGITERLYRKTQGPLVPHSRKRPGRE